MGTSTAKGEELISLTVRLPREQYEALRKLSFDSRESIAEHIRRALREYLAQKEPERKN